MKRQMNPLKSESNMKYFLESDFEDKVLLIVQNTGTITCYDIKTPCLKNYSFSTVFMIVFMKNIVKDV
jgi:hypothetical protein